MNMKLLDVTKKNVMSREEEMGREEAVGCNLENKTY